VVVLVGELVLGSDGVGDKEELVVNVLFALVFQALG